ncbi:uncharacterized protein [Diabrotica undecimpunctata]|uniref:uncharacterized protein isoform X1 n=1 Tax=Diabrotica undecimpunctata TaxID=50387 RepID=UPI003B642665
MASNKRERCVNWESEEKVSNLRDYLNTIENKDLSTNTNKSKLNAWLQITERFNAANVRTRDKKQLMNQWKLAKINCKKQMSQLRRELNKTGGGPKPPSPPPEVLEIAKMIPLELEVDHNEFDSDGVKESVVAQNIEVEVLNYCSTSFGESAVAQKIEVEDINYPSTSFVESAVAQNIEQEVLNYPSTSFGIQHHDIEETRMSKSIPTPKRATKKTLTSTNTFNFSKASYEDMHYFRVQENKRLMKEHKLRVKHMCEQHAQTMKILKLQEDILKKKKEENI